MGPFVRLFCFEIDRNGGLGGLSRLGVVGFVDLTGEVLNGARP